jgi:hypothetical protein
VTRGGDQVRSSTATGRTAALAGYLAVLDPDTDVTIEDTPEKARERESTGLVWAACVACGRPCWAVVGFTPYCSALCQWVWHNG